MYRIEANGSATYLNKVVAPDKAAGRSFRTLRFPVRQYSRRRGSLADPDGIQTRGAAYTFDISAYASANTPPTNLNPTGTLYHFGKPANRTICR